MLNYLSMVEKPLNSKTLGRRLKQERQRLNMTQEAVARATGVRRVTVYQYEIGDRFASLEFLLNVAKAGVSLQYLLFGERRVIEVGDQFVDAKLVLDLYRLVDRVAVDEKGRSLHVDDRVELLEELLSIAANLRLDEVDDSKISAVIERFAA